MTDATAPRPKGRTGTGRPERPDERTRGTRGRDRAIRYCQGPGLLRAVRGATANVERHVPELNALNVYPVPDGDTGINMIATMRAALAEVDALTDGQATLGDLAAAIAFGALMGARGNSGVILSQVFRGMADSISGKRRADARDLAAALTAGTQTAYNAVARPVEGTILTVVREAAAAAVAAAERGAPLSEALAVATEAARVAVERTPEQLDVLREAGVVDAGGQGLYRALEGALTVLGDADAVQDSAGDRTSSTDSMGPKAAARELPKATRPAAAERGADAGPNQWGYETVYLLRGREPLDLAAVRRQLEEIGESILVAGDAHLAKIHIHNARPDAALAVGLSLGTLSEISVMNLDEQTGRHLGPDGALGDIDSPTTPTTPLPGDTRSLAVVAVAEGEGFADVLASFGVDEIVHAPRWGNPSTGEILAALRRSRARHVIVLPNDSDVVMAAEQAAGALPDREIVVVPTRSAPEGFAALLAMDPAVGARANLAPMLAAARDVQTLLVAIADRPSRLAGRTVTAGQTVVLGPDAGLVAAAADPVDAIVEAVGTLDDGYELLTFYVGDGGSDDEARVAIERIGEGRPGTEAEVMPGGQPHYRYVISAE